MRRAFTGALAAVMAVALFAVPPARAGSGGLHEVAGVDDGDMLKMRAGPGTGYRILLGLPNGTALRLHECQQTGSTRWCLVSLRHARGVRGYVSAGYLRRR
ncbi:SH3 domain-containing protein [Sedimentitalea sp. JM2-8]|uniref:SH3 domain-containing protein n=1 Tax=Sedimentitalea xiamensis TaxID=3050037 RepID=A0ABT7FKN9_9RHOB|nr:SH3 domain-containing protein [Sedimentitalea xiamensis]MDK3075712.1 SH3 domain-containing protein [Sedimentitalea xiamensis]